MRIAILSPVWFAVPPSGYGGIEWIVSLLADGLADAGHDVTLFASGDSRTKAMLAYVFEHAPSEQIGQSGAELRHALACLEQAEDFDVINDHSGMTAAALGGLVETPVLHTVHGPLGPPWGEDCEQIAPINKRLALVSVSMTQRRPAPDLPWTANVPNALELSLYPCKPHRGEYLLFLGRMSPDRRPPRAAPVPMETALPVKLPGKSREPMEKEYF